MPLLQSIYLEIREDIGGYTELIDTLRLPKGERMINAFDYRFGSAVTLNVFQFHFRLIFFFSISFS